MRSEQDDEEDTPSFLEDDLAEDVEIVTDSGDEDTERVTSGQRPATAMPTDGPAN